MLKINKYESNHVIEISSRNYKKGICKKCGQESDYILGDFCIHCSSEKCYVNFCFKNTLTCQFRFNQIYADFPLRESVFPCFSYPICKALSENNPNWREVKPLQQVPYQVVVCVEDEKEG